EPAYDRTRITLRSIRATQKTSKRPVPVDVQHHAVERIGGTDVKVIPLRPAEHDVGADLRDLHLADQRAVAVEAVHAVIRGGPQPPVGVEAHAVEAPGRAVGEFRAAGELAVFSHVEYADVLGLALHAPARAID